MMNYNFSLKMQWKIEKTVGYEKRVQCGGHPCNRNILKTHRMFLMKRAGVISCWLSMQIDIEDMRILWMLIEEKNQRKPHLF